MQSVFRGRHFINLEDFTKEEVDTMLEVSLDLKKKFAMGIPTPYLLHQSMFLMFFEQSTRTRNSMEAGFAQLGGHAGFLDSSSIRLLTAKVPRIRPSFCLVSVMRLPAVTAIGAMATNISPKWPSGRPSQL